MAAALAIAVLLAACGGGGEVAGDGGRSDASATAQGEAERLLSVTAPTVDGDQFEGAGLIGRHVAIWFWAPW